jgi:hypothetical protein
VTEGTQGRLGLLAGNQFALDVVPDDLARVVRGRRLLVPNVKSTLAMKRRGSKSCSPVGTRDALDTRERRVVVAAHQFRPTDEDRWG